MNVYEKSLRLHGEWKGKISTEPKSEIKNAEDLTYAYTPGVAEPCRKIHDDEVLAYDYTIKNNTIAVVSNGTAVLGLGDIGAKASLPVMEGKCVLFKKFGKINAFPIVIDSKDPDVIVETVKNISGGFGGINLEDIKSPECVYIENKLKKELDIPVFHDDQHGTAIVVTAALINSLKLTKKDKGKIKVVISGAGAAGASITKLLLQYGIKNIIICDSKGIVDNTYLQSKNPVKQELAKITNKENQTGTLKDALKGADVFVGVSAPNIMDETDIKNMNEEPIVFALANPTPEIDYNLAKEAGARVVATGRSDFPNQINNLLAFPGIFKGALSVRAKAITDEMKLAAAKSIASLIPEEDIAEDRVIESVFETDVAEVVAENVREVVKRHREMGEDI